MIHSEIDAQVVLVSARKSRGAVHWDYDVRLGDASGAVIGRIMRHPQAPEDQPWYWTITAREQLFRHGDDCAFGNRVDLRLLSVPRCVSLCGSSC